MIQINPDKEKVEKIRQAIRENDGYCPCKIERKDDNKCLCREFLNQEDGYCHCGLYFKTKY